MSDLPDNLRLLDEKLVPALNHYAPPSDLDAKISGYVSRRNRMRIGLSPRLSPRLSPGVVKTAAAVVVIGLLAGFGYVADRQLNHDDSRYAAAPQTRLMGWVATSSRLSDEDARMDVESFSYDKGARTSELEKRKGESQIDGRYRLGEKHEPSDVAGDEIRKALDKNYQNPDAPTASNEGVTVGRQPPPTNSPHASEYVQKEQQEQRGQEGGGGGGGGAIINGTFSLGDADGKARQQSELRSADLYFRPGPTKPNEELEKNTGKLDANKPADGPAPIVVSQTEQPGKPGAPSAVPPPAEPATPAAAVINSQKVIRSGTVEFEVDSFDTSLMTITKLVVEQGGFVASTDSAKLSNGKMRGSVTLRIPPARLDTFVLMLRGIGDLKGQKISAQDVSKQYTDVESGLRAARAMEARLLEMIQAGKGSIKDLLAAEKELGVWREKIEQMEGEKRYYDNLISLSTLTVTLQERDIKASAASIEVEEISAGLETDDVDKARGELLKAIDEAKGRIITSELKKLDAGQFAATLVAEVPPDRAGPVVDRIKQLGKVARLDMDRKQTTVDGTGAPLPGSQVEKKPTTIRVSIYNLANVAPRLTTNATLATSDVEVQYRRIVDEVEKSNGRVVTSSLQRPQSDQIIATVQIEVPAAQAAVMKASIESVGEVMNLQLVENSDTANVTTAKQGFVVRMVSATAVPARETITLQIASKDVAAAHQSLIELVNANKSRVYQSSVVENDRDNRTALLQVDLPRTAMGDWEKTQSQAGDLLTRQINRSTDVQNTLDTKVRLNVQLYQADRLPPRQTTVATLRVDNAESVQQAYIAQAEQAGGRVIDQNVSRDTDGRSSARVVMDIPRDKAGAIITQFRSNGEIWSMNTSTNPQAPDGSLSRVRFELNLTEAVALIGKDDGIMASVKNGLSTSLRGLAWSLQLIVIGLCLVIPWALVLWATFKFFRRNKRQPTTVDQTSAV